MRSTENPLQISVIHRWHLFWIEMVIISIKIWLWYNMLIWIKWTCMNSIRRCHTESPRTTFGATHKKPIKVHSQMKVPTDPTCIGVNHFGRFIGLTKLPRSSLSWWIFKTWTWEWDAWLVVIYWRWISFTYPKCCWALALIPLTTTIPFVTHFEMVIVCYRV